MSRREDGECRHDGKVYVIGVTADALGRPWGAAKVLWCFDCGSIATSDAGPALPWDCYREIIPGSSAWMPPETESPRRGTARIREEVP
jgi:hypothetical protein